MEVAVAELVAAAVNVAVTVNVIVAENVGVAAQSHVVPKSMSPTLPPATAKLHLNHCLMACPLFS